MLSYLATPKINPVIARPRLCVPFFQPEYGHNTYRLKNQSEHAEGKSQSALQAIIALHLCHLAMMGAIGEW